MISGFILLEVAATILLVYGFTQEEKIVQLEDQIIKKIVKAVRK